jgi:hypothetical protein
MKTDSLGDTLWTREIYGRSNHGYSVQQTTDGGYVICAQGNTLDIHLTKTDSLGNTLWTRAFGGTSEDCGYSVRQTACGGYVIAGYTRSYGAGSYGAYLIQTDSLGDTLWTRTYGGALADYGYSVQQTADGGYIIAGSTRSFGAGYSDVYLIKTNRNGIRTWDRTFGGTSDDYSYSVHQTSDGGYIIAGATCSYGMGSSDVYLVRTNAAGDPLWTKAFGGDLWDYGRSVQQTQDGGYIVAGYTRSYGAGYSDVYLIRTDPTGDTLWTKTFGGPRADYAYSVQQTTDGGYVISGKANGGCLYLIKTDSRGNVKGVEEANSRLSISSCQLTVHPNPFVRSATINYQLPIESYVSLTISDITGRAVKTLAGEKKRAGRHETVWDAKRLTGGVYFAKIAVGDFQKTTKLVLLR